MDNKEHEAYIKKIKAYTAKLLKSKADCMRFSTQRYIYKIR